jgi:hypothetical protein
MRDINKRFKMTLLKLLSVRRAKKRYNLTKSLKYTSSLFGASRWFLMMRFCFKSIPFKDEDDDDEKDQRAAREKARRTIFEEKKNFG